jgi:hypothetical protein
MRKHTNENISLPTAVNLQVKNLTIVDPGSASGPMLTFNTASGWYMNEAEEIVLSTKGLDNIIQKHEYTEFMQPIKLTDCDESLIPQLIEGILYKKPGDTGLWWRTTEGEINIVNGAFNSRQPAPAPPTPAPTTIPLSSAPPPAHAPEESPEESPASTSIPLSSAPPPAHAPAQSPAHAPEESPAPPTPAPPTPATPPPAPPTPAPPLDTDAFVRNGPDVNLCNGALALSESVAEINTMLQVKHKDELILKANSDAIVCNKPIILTGQGILFGENSELRWKTDTSEQVLSTYEPFISYTAGNTIRTGDVICLNNGIAYKYIGGKVMHVSRINHANMATPRAVMYSVKYFKESSLLCVSLNTHTLFLLLNDAGLEMARYQYNNLTEYSTVIYCKNDICMLSVMNGTFVITKLSDIFATCVIQVTPLNLKASQVLNLAYDESNDILVLASYTNKLNINLINLANVYIGAHIDIPTEPIGHINLILLPGGIIIVSYAHHKTVLLYTFYDSPIVVGNTLYDYQCVKNISMIYDPMNSIIVSLDKSVTNTSYIQSFELVNLSLNYVAKKALSHIANPLTLTYNANCYLLTYLQDNIVYHKHIKYDAGINLNISYKGQNGPLMSDIFVHPFGKNFISVYNQRIELFINNFQGNPSEFVGIARTDALAGERVSVCIKGALFDSDIYLPAYYCGNKVYLNNVEADYPYNLSVQADGIFIGTCVSRNNIVVSI